MWESHTHTESHNETWGGDPCPRGQTKTVPLLISLSLRLLLFTCLSCLWGGCYPPTPAFPYLAPTHTTYIHTQSPSHSLSFWPDRMWDEQYKLVVFGVCTLFPHTCSESYTDTHHWDCCFKQPSIPTTSRGQQRPFTPPLCWAPFCMQEDCPAEQLDRARLERERDAARGPPGCYIIRL